MSELMKLESKISKRKKIITDVIGASRIMIKAINCYIMSIPLANLVRRQPMDEKKTQNLQKQKSMEQTISQKD